MKTSLILIALITASLTACASHDDDLLGSSNARISCKTSSDCGTGFQCEPEQSGSFCKRHGSDDGSGGKQSGTDDTAGKHSGTDDTAGKSSGTDDATDDQGAGGSDDGAHDVADDHGAGGSSGDDSTKAEGGAHDAGDDHGSSGSSDDSGHGTSSSASGGASGTPLARPCTKDSDCASSERCKSEDSGGVCESDDSGSSGKG
jgi:hypothetical protein